MPTDLSTLIPSFQRQVAIPGTFTDAYPNTTDDDVVGTLADAFAEAQLDGWFGTYVYDPDTTSVLNNADPDPLTNGLSLAGQALIVIYAGMRMVTNQIMNTKSSVRYKAGPVEYETQQGATTLNELLKMLAARKAELLALARGNVRDVVIDGYYSRALAFHTGELPSTWARGALALGRY